MSQYRGLHGSFWDSDYVEDSLDSYGTLLYIYLITSPKSNMEGLYKCSINRICRQCKLERDIAQRWLARLEADGYGGWCDGWVCVTQAAAHFPTGNPQLLTHAKRVYAEVPEAIMAWALSIGYRPVCHIDGSYMGHRNERTEQTNELTVDDEAVSTLLRAVGLPPSGGGKHGKKQRGG